MIYEKRVKEGILFCSYFCYELHLLFECLHIVMYTHCSIYNLHETKKRYRKISK